MGSVYPEESYSGASRSTASFIVRTNDVFAGLTCLHTQPNMRSHGSICCMIGQTISHYRIVEKIGAGGMGEVYRAHDERLDRDVALKVLLSSTLADSNAIKLFRNEAQILCKLNHPNIATVHDFDTQDGVSFLVMEYINGVTLDKRLAEGLPSEKA